MTTIHSNILASGAYGMGSCASNAPQWLLQCTCCACHSGCVHRSPCSRSHQKRVSPHHVPACTPTQTPGLQPCVCVGGEGGGGGMSPHIHNLPAVWKLKFTFYPTSTLCQPMTFATTVSPKFTRALVDLEEVFFCFFNYTVGKELLNVQTQLNIIVGT